MLEDSVHTPIRGEPHISLEEIDSDEVIVRIAATPLSDDDGPRLADEVLAAVAAITSEERDRSAEGGDEDESAAPIGSPSDELDRGTRVTNARMATDARGRGGRR